MRNIVCLIVLVCIIAVSSVFAQSAKSKQGTTVMKGYLMDKMCGSGLSQKTVEQATAKAARHTKVCAMEDGCAASGYGLVMNGKWTAFDEKGNKKASEYLMKTKAEDHLFVAVTGSLKNETISVTSIKETKE